MTELLSIKQVAGMFDVSDDTIRRLIRTDQKLRAYKVRGQYRIEKDSLLEILKTPYCRNVLTEKIIQKALDDAGIIVTASQTATLTKSLLESDLKGC